MRIFFCLLFALLSTTVKASGFGWYLYVYDWQTVDRDVTSSIDEYKSLAGTNPLLINHFQQEIDSSITDLCNGAESGNKFEAYSLGLTPFKNDFYSQKTISYLKENDSSGTFSKFSNSSNAYLIGKTRGVQTDPYVVFSPAEVIKALKAVRSLRQKGGLSKSLELQLTYMEAAFMIAASERYEDEVPDDESLGVLFCGRN